MAISNARPEGPKLRLVEPPLAADPALALADPAARREFAELTQALVDAAIEIMDIIDGNPDIEPNGDEAEDDDGI